jgi:hypothetical protein
MAQIRLSRDLEESARAARTPMTVDELLAEYVKAFSALLRVAQKPSPCSSTASWW